MKAACSYPTEPGARMYKAAIDKINADNHTKSTPHAALARKGVSDSDDLLHRSSCSAGSLAAAATAHPRSSAPWSDAPPPSPRAAIGGRQGARLRQAPCERRSLADTPPELPAARQLDVHRRGRAEQTGDGSDSRPAARKRATRLLSSRLTPRTGQVLAGG